MFLSAVNETALKAIKKCLLIPQRDEKAWLLFVVPPTFRVARLTMAYAGYTCIASKGKFNALYLTVNGVKSYTLLALCRLARGIAFLQVGALSAADASSLSTPGKEHVSRLRHRIALFLNPTIPDFAF